MEAEKKKRRRWRDIPLATKMILAVGSIMVMMLVINMILYEQVNNVDLTDLSASLENVQQALYSYLSVKTSDSLENYYRCEQEYRYLLENLSSQISSNPSKLLERNIRQMSETYLSLTGEGVAAKRGVQRNLRPVSEDLRLH